MTLKYPNMREELIGLLADLAASEHVSDEQIAFPGYGFAEWFNLVDDVLANGAEAATGIVLNPNEAEPVADFLHARDTVWRDLGRLGSFAQFRRHPGWPAVITTARHALSVMGR
jgi:hypothetical protein